MENPWSKLPSQAPFVLEIGRRAVIEHNRSATEDSYIHIEDFPAPFSGNPLNACVILLTAHPGWVTAGNAFHQDDELVQTAYKKNLVHESQEYPLFMLDPKLDDYPGYKYWTEKLGAVVESFDAKYIAERVSGIQYFPYPSVGESLKSYVPSQAYSFELKVRQAISREALIVIMNAHRKWLRSVGVLRTVPYLLVRNPRNPTITTRNLPPRGFDILLAALRR